MNGKDRTLHFSALKHPHSFSFFPFLLNLILLDVLSVIHHGLMLAAGDPENHGGWREERRQFVVRDGHLQCT